MTLVAYYLGPVCYHFARVWGHFLFIYDRTKMLYPPNAAIVVVRVSVLYLSIIGFHIGHASEETVVILKDAWWLKTNIISCDIHRIIYNVYSLLMELKAIISLSLLKFTQNLNSDKIMVQLSTTDLYSIQWSLNDSRTKCLGCNSRVLSCHNPHQHTHNQPKHGDQIPEKNSISSSKSTYLDVHMQCGLSLFAKIASNLWYDFYTINNIWNLIQNVYLPRKVQYLSKTKFCSLLYRICEKLACCSATFFS